MSELVLDLKALGLSDRIQIPEGSLAYVIVPGADKTEGIYDKYAILDKGMTNGDRIREACAILQSVVEVLDNPRRSKIVECLPSNSRKTFDQLRQETAIPSGSLHRHLGILEQAGLIGKTAERPAMYYRDDLLDRLICLVSRRVG